jgi:Amidohydrolase
VIRLRSARHPGRFADVAAVGLARPMDAVRELRRCARDLGFRALRVVPWLWDLPPSDRRYYPMYAECVQLGIPFCLQVGHIGPLCPSEPGRPIPYLDTVALEFPQLVIVGGNIGYPWTAEMIGYWLEARSGRGRSICGRGCRCQRGPRRRWSPAARGVRAPWPRQPRPARAHGWPRRRAGDGARPVAALSARRIGQEGGHGSSILLHPAEMLDEIPRNYEQHAAGRGT